jgi:hypothetical protein
MNTNRVGNSGANKSMMNKMKSSSNRYILFLILILILAIFLWYYYSRERSDINSKLNPVLISKEIMPTNSSLSTGTPLTIPSDHPYGIQYTYNFWINVHDLDYNYGKKKNVFYNAVNSYSPNNSPNSDHNPFVYIAENTNALMIDIKTQDGNTIFGIQNFPIMRWVFVSIVLNNRSLDVYIDGKLERSFILPNLPAMPTSSYVFKIGKQTNTDTFSGKINRLQYFSKALGPNEIYDIYLQGPTTSSIFQTSFFS